MGRAKSFLARWSRRKRLSAARAREPAHTPIPEATAPDTPPASAARAEDVAPQQLPPIESLDADSEITAFLAPGVPTELTRQALRRAWTADPVIRDFIGLSENAWDFTAAGGVPGFGSLPAEDAGRLLARALGAARNDDAPAPGEHAAAPNGETAADRSAGDRDCHRARQIADDAAMQQDFDEAEINRPPPPHSHGRALPK
jgi:hypothetical protein